MMETITYNIRESNGSSDQYYEKIHTFSRFVYDYMENKTGYIITDYVRYLNTYDIEKIRSREEYAIELMTLGMTWERYLGAAKHTNALLLRFMIYLFRLRSRQIWIKPEIDRIRGWISGHFITPKISKYYKNRRPSFHNFRKLLLWLKASGEFQNEVKRLAQWYEYCLQQGKERGKDVILKAVEIIKWFEPEARAALGRYTENVNYFLNEKHPQYRYREDEIFTGKEPVEYFLNMVGAEIMNRGLAPEFYQTKRSVVLLPKCMANPENSGCKAKQTGLDIICSHCSPQCNISRISNLGKENNFDVRIVPHSSGFTAWLKRWQNDPDIGLVAVACLLNLVLGGYEMRKLGLKAQCLLLDYCGCKKHWHPHGIPTDINEHKLLKIINKYKPVLLEPELQY